MCPPITITNGGHDATDNGGEVDEVDDDINGDVVEQDDDPLDSFEELEGEEEEESLDESGQEHKLEYSKFDPPLYKQRYSTVMEVLQDERWIQAMNRIVDFGCAECKFVKILRDMPRVREIIGVDFDLDLLEYCQRWVEPLFTHYLEPRTQTPLELILMHGDVSVFDKRLANVDAVTAIELIEHLPSNVLEQFPKTIFEYMKPKLVIFTTPNQEYNVLFENFEGPFRHYDHKFEWTRAEFQDWVQTKIIDKYPEYLVYKFDGIGEGPGHIGHCSQYCVIVRKDFYEAARNGCFDQMTLEEDDNNAKNRSFVIINDNIMEDGEYKIVTHYNYPMKREDRTRTEIILDEVNYYSQMYASGSEEWAEGLPAKVDLDYLLSYEKINKHNCDILELREILSSNGFQIEEDLEVINVVVPYVEKDDFDEENSDARDNVFEESEQLQEEHCQYVEQDYEDGWD